MVGLLVRVGHPRRKDLHGHFLLAALVHVAMLALILRLDLLGLRRPAAVASADDYHDQDEADQHAQPGQGQDEDD